MILLETNFTNILLLPMAIGGLYLAIKFYAYLIAGMTKMSGKQLYINGRKAADPDSFDNMLEHDKQKLLKLKNIAINVGNRLKNMGNTSHGGKQVDLNQILNNKTNDKIKQVQAITELKDIGAITKDEFDFLKNEILNK